MRFEFTLSGGRRVFFRVHVDVPGEGAGGGELEFGGQEVKELVDLLSLAGNERRLRIMIELMKRPETRFTDLLGVGINPKLVRDCLVPLESAGLVEHRKGGIYRPSSKGAAVIVTLTLGLRKVLDLPRGAGP
ncbi:MAG: hypothetical protein HY247_01520 [archaeon]|nr:MAG: hypothetical protein HY247_01520 [archaeon]